MKGQQIITVCGQVSYKGESSRMIRTIYVRVIFAYVRFAVAYGYRRSSMVIQIIVRTAYLLYSFLN